jgi:hypothetical protein
VVAILVEGHRDILAGKTLGQPQAQLPRHRFVGEPVQQPHRQVDRDRLAQQQVPPAILNEGSRIEVPRRVEVRGENNRAALDDFLALRRAEPRPQQFLSEIGRPGDADQPGHAPRPRQRREQHDPAAHARSDEDLRTGRQRIDDCDCVLLPASDRALGEVAARRAMPEIVETHKGASAVSAIIL